MEAYIKNIISIRYMHIFKQINFFVTHHFCCCSCMTTLTPLKVLVELKTKFPKQTLLCDFDIKRHQMKKLRSKRFAFCSECIVIQKVDVKIILKKSSNTDKMLHANSTSSFYFSKLYLEQILPSG